jgi:hypothetical protein
LLPPDLAVNSAERFFRDLRVYSDEDSSLIELADTTLAEANAVSLRAAYHSIELVVASFHHHREVHTLRVATGYASILRTLHQHDAIQRIQRVLHRLLDHLPAPIRLDVPEIMANMKEHKKNTGKAGGGGAHQPAAPPAASDFSMRRRRAERIAMTFDTREFDPLWAFVLSEVQCFNKTISALRTSIHGLAETSLGLLEFVKSRGVTLTSLAQQRALSHTLHRLHRGQVPHHLCRSRLPMHVDDWCRELHEQASQLTEWLTTGYAGKLRLHQLVNPKGLLYAMKETFCMRTDNMLDKVYFAYTVHEPTNVLLADALTISKTNFGCSVMIADLYLHNAQFAEKSAALEFLPEHSASSYGKVSFIFRLRSRTAVPARTVGVVCQRAFFDRELRCLYFLPGVCQRRSAYIDIATHMFPVVFIRFLLLETGRADQCHQGRARVQRGGVPVPRLPAQPVPLLRRHPGTPRLRA